MDEFNLISSGAFFGSISLWYLLKCHKSEQSDVNDVFGTVEPLALPVVDVNIFLRRNDNPELYNRECNKIAEALRQYGCAVIRDPRVDYEFNNTFLDMMERYFSVSDGKRDARPQYAYQVGVTPEFVERARNHCSRMGSLGPGNKPLSPCPPELDCKWRFFWRIGKPPVSSKFPQLNMAPVIPPEIPEWETVMNSWGERMLDALHVAAEMSATGFGLPSDAFTKLMDGGPHLLAPTGTDLSKYGDKNRIIAGYHYDLNFLTIHGKSRYPGLYVWTRDGTKKQVKVPDGCLLIQAGKQMEYLTGGHVVAGFHEVVVNDNTIAAIANRRSLGKPLWRVSSTLFGHIASDNLLEPLGKFKTPEAVAKYTPILTGDQVSEELKVIKLGAQGV